MSAHSGAMFNRRISIILLPYSPRRKQRLPTHPTQTGISKYGYRAAGCRQVGSVVRVHGAPYQPFSPPESTTMRETGVFRIHRSMPGESSTVASGTGVSSFECHRCGTWNMPEARSIFEISGGMVLTCLRCNMRQAVSRALLAAEHSSNCFTAGTEQG